MNRIRTINEAVEKLEFVVDVMIEKYGAPVLARPQPAQDSRQTFQNSSQVYSSAPARPQSTVVASGPRNSYANPANVNRSSFKDFISFKRNSNAGQDNDRARQQVQ